MSTAAATMTMTMTATTSASSAATSALSDPRNPLLEYQPNFSHALVVQLLVLSAVAALHIVLLLHLAFTTKYHLPLARVNYILLTSGCLTSFAALFWQMVEVCIKARDRSLEWPFMFDYLQFKFPLQAWPTGTKIAWLVLGAVVVFLCHAAHIHVLTLLYPSKLESRLFMALLLPLAFISCALSFAPLLPSQREQDIFDSGAAVCNSTLTLLYTCALMFWGGYIARKRAWGQADESGSTAVFGGCALGMAFLGTVLSFVSISRGAESIENGSWLDRVTWLVLLWQTWFSVWWWIGAGMYGAERPLDDDDDGREGVGPEAEERNKLLSAERLRAKRKYAENSLKRYFGRNPSRLRMRGAGARRSGIASDGDADGSLAHGEEIEMAPITRSSSTASRMSNTRLLDSESEHGQISRVRSRPASSGGLAVPPRRPATPSEARATLDSSESSESNSSNTPPTFINTLIRTVRKAHVRAAKAAHRELMQTAEQNPGMNDALVGRKGKGWSVSGIMKSREDHVAREAANTERRRSGPAAQASREDRRTGAARLSEDDTAGGGGGRAGMRDTSDAMPWIDVDDDEQAYPPRRPPRNPRQSARLSSVQPSPVMNKKFQNWRRKDVTTYD